MGKKKSKNNCGTERLEAYKAFVHELGVLERIMIPEEKFTKIVEQFTRTLTALATYLYFIENTDNGN